MCVRWSAGQRRGSKSSFGAGVACWPNTLGQATLVRPKPRRPESLLYRATVGSPLHWYVTARKRISAPEVFLILGDAYFGFFDLSAIDRRSYPLSLPCTAPR